jgi:hypothetical protein
MMPETHKVIIDKVINLNQNSNLLRDERSDAIGALKAAISTMAIGLPGDFANLCTNVAPNVRFDIRQTDANGLGGILNSW